MKGSKDFYFLWNTGINGHYVGLGEKDSEQENILVVKTLYSLENKVMHVMIIIITSDTRKTKQKEIIVGYL